MRRFAIPTILAIAALLSAGLANAEFSQTGNLRLAFSGRIAPKKLPRTDTAPVTVRISGAIGTADGGRPPQLSKVAIAFNRYGRVSTGGCRPATTANSSRRRPNGHGTMRRRAGRAGQIQGERRFLRTRTGPVTGDMLAFNAKKAGKPALLLHVYGSQPVQLAFVLTFRIVHVKKGTFGTIFVAHIPDIASKLGYVTNVNLTFGRRYTYEGQQRSFLSAKCAAPSGFPRGDLHPRPRQLQLQQRTAHKHLAGSQLLGPLAAPSVPTQAYLGGFHQSSAGLSSGLSGVDRTA